MATFGVYDILFARFLVGVIREFSPKIPRTIGGSAPSVGVTYHGAPCQETSHALSCTVGTIALDELQLEHSLAVVVDVAVAPEVVVVVNEFVIALLDYFERCFLRQVEVILIARATIEVGSHVGAVVSSACGQACHGEIETAQHTVGGIFVDASSLSLTCREMLGCIFQVSDGKLDDIFTRLCWYHIVVYQV